VGKKAIAVPFFEVQSYIGSEIAQFRADGERPPRSAKLVACVSWSWSPAHSRSARYLLSTTRNRSVRILWEEGVDYDSGKPLYAMVAEGAPYRGVSPKTAAENLLREVWRKEFELDSADIRDVDVDLAGLLEAKDIERIAAAVSGLD
jgi:hypothetical protein